MPRDEIAGGEPPRFRNTSSPLGTGGIHGELEVGDMSALRAVEMAVLLKIGAETGRLAIHMDRLDQTAADHRLETIVDCGERYGGDPFLDPQEDLGGRGVIPLLHQHLVNMPALRSEAQPTRFHC